MALMILSFSLMLYAGYALHASLPIAVSISGEDPVKTEAIKSLEVLNAPPEKINKLATGITLASKATGLSSSLITCIMSTESSFNERAVSPKNYKGLMQTPSATFIYSDVDILHGARILKDKLSMTNDNLYEALTLYKGGKNSLARKQAQEVIDLYKKVKNEIQV